MVEFENDSATKKKFHLKSGEQLTCRANDGSFEKTKFEVLAVTGWKDGTICFKSSKFREVVKTLENWYNVDIEVTGNTSNIYDTSWTYTGQFENQNLENVLRGISYVKDFSFKINDKKVTLMFN
jgi:ferric-dicitrate binding protein FerR (iron transport regulator)